MAIHSDRRFRFDATRPEVWDALARVDRYRCWWPWLHRFDGERLASGETWRCLVKPPLPYRVSFSITVTDVVEHQSASARLAGDIVGTATITAADDGAGCLLRLVSDLTAIGGPARHIGRFAPWLAATGHDWILDQGIRQFRAHALDG